MKINTTSSTGLGVWRTSFQTMKLIDLFLRSGDRNTEQQVCSPAWQSYTPQPTNVSALGITTDKRVAWETGSIVGKYLVGGKSLL